jgi:hypothetical protein
MLPYQDIDDDVFAISSTDDDPLIEQFGTSGYTNYNILRNLGSIFTYLIGILAVMAAFFFVKKYAHKYSKLKYLYIKFSKVVYCNLLLRFLIENYLELSICSMLSSLKFLD